MVNVIRLRKGLDINLKGKAEQKKIGLKPTGLYALQPDGFVGIVPKVVVKEGEQVDAGQALFVDKKHPEIQFVSPVSGTVKAVVRGERRKVMSVQVEAAAEQQSVNHGKKDPKQMQGSQVLDHLLKAGLFGFINQLPYDVVANPEDKPKAIFVSALRDKPLAADFEYELKGQEQDWQTGLTALSRMAKVYLGVGARQTAKALLEAEDVEVTVFDGPCPAGNVSVQVNHLNPVNKGEVVWTVEPTAVIFIGRLMNTGCVDLTRTVAFVGSEVNKPAYVDMKVGQELATLLANSLKHTSHVRIINGNVLTGVPTTKDGFLAAHASEVTVIPEGDDVDEMAGWIMPRFNQFSSNRSYFSWLMGKAREYALDARVKGGERHMIMSGEYDRVFPMNIFPEYLVKAIIANDIDRMEQLGIYEVAPEDFALAEFVCSSKLELQRIVRNGLDMLRNENS